MVESETLALNMFPLYIMLIICLGEFILFTLYILVSLRLGETFVIIWVSLVLFYGKVGEIEVSH